MLAYLGEKWKARDIGMSEGQINPADEYVPCLAHVLHNCVLALLKNLSAEPADSIDPYDKDIEQGLDAQASQMPRYSQFDDATSSRSTMRQPFASLRRLHGFAQVLGKIREIAKASCNSTQRSEEFQTHVKGHLGHNLKLMIDVRTRWHSTAAMLQRALYLETPIRDWLRKRPELMPIRLEDREWAQVKIILSILTPFWSCTLKLMGSDSLNIHQTIRVYAHLQRQLTSFKQKLSLYPSPACKALLSSIDAALAKLQKYYSKTDNNLTYFLADYLLPHKKGSLFKKQFWDDRGNQSCFQEHKDQLELRFDNVYLKRPLSQEELAHVVEHNSVTGASQREYTRTQSLFNSSDIEDVDDLPPIRSRDQLTSYLNEPKIRLRRDETHDVLTYWKDKQDMWPDLALMARDVLAVPATGADVERLFSQGRNAINHHRHKLKSQTISDIMFCRGATKRKLSSSTMQKVGTLRERYKETCVTERWASFSDFRRLEKNTALPLYTMLFDEENEEELHATLLEMNNMPDGASQESVDDITI